MGGFPLHFMIFSHIDILLRLLWTLVTYFNNILEQLIYLQISPPVQDVDERLPVDHQSPVLGTRPLPGGHLAELLGGRDHRARLLVLLLNVVQMVPDRRLGRVAAPRVQLYDLHFLEKNSNKIYQISAIS